MTNTEAQQVLGTMLMRYDLTDAELEAIGMAGEALEDDALMPLSRPYDLERCPRCEGMIFKASGDYCPKCGQHIDWGKEEEHET